MSHRRVRTRRTREFEQIFGRDGGEAQLPSDSGEQVSESKTDNLSMQKLVKPDGIQRPPNGYPATDAGIRERGIPDGPPSVSLGTGRRRNTR